ncbi:hypothetical protein PV04_05073 [Phialophora macrospora]|uniref:Uncharacterized protein n=1 Tax=Phialophora macrospora TaxID=1851006 RepID=A0A0D2FRJ9_9EURO|nr:hypothetical protein PV04_05073 [Phialophora macrospora]
MVKHEADVPVQYETAWAPMDQQARNSVSRVLAEVLDGISWGDYSSHTSWQMIVRWASRNGHLETVERILDAVPVKFVEEIDRQEQTKAERRGSTTVKGEQMPSAPKEIALFWAALGGYKDIVSVLLKHPSLKSYYHGSERSSNRCLRAAQAAARNGHFSIVTALIQHMHSCSGVDTQGWKPLDWAVAFGDPDIVRLMLIKGAEPLASSQRLTKSQEIDKLLRNPQPTPRWYSRESPLSVWSSKPQLKLAPFEAACKRFNACVVDFYRHDGGMYPLEMSGRSIYDVIYNPDLGPNKIMEDARQTVEDHPAMHNSHRFRWIHLPANNWKWVQDLMKRICYQTKQEKECWSLQKFAESNRREHVGRPQSRFMFPDIRIENSKTGRSRSDKGARSIPLQDADVGSDEFGHLLGRRMAIYMPFITVETVQEQQQLQNACQEAMSEGLTSKNINALENLQDIANARKDAVLFLTEDIHGHLKELYNAIGTSNWSLSSGTIEVLDHLAKAAKGAPASGDGTLVQASGYDFSGLDLKKVIEEQRTISGPYHPNDSAQKVLMQFYLRAGEPNALHIRRTLDQYYYPALPDDRTKSRDGDQVVYRFQHRELKRAQKDTGFETLRNLRICTVDQLWLWVIDEKTVITCFPQRWNQSSPQGNGTAKGLPDALEFIRDRIHNDGNLELNTVYHLATLITSLCTSFVDECTAEPSASSETFLQIFANAIGIESDDESDHFEEFKKGVKELENVALDDDDAKAQESSLDKSLKISKEVDCLNEVKDIRDELKMISSIFSHQKFVLGELRKEASRESSASSRDGECPYSNFVSELPEYSDLETRSDQVRKMEDDAAAVYVRLNHLLDLKQKHANFLEAGLAREQAQQMADQTSKLNDQAIESGKEAKTILFLTFVTIVFAPMSFLTSLYALNVSAFSGGYVKGDELTYSSEWLFSRVFGISTAVAIPLILLALLVGGFLEKTVAGLKKWCADLPINQTSETANATSQALTTPDATRRNPSPPRATTPPSRSRILPKPAIQGNVNGGPIAPSSARRPTGLAVSNSSTQDQQPKQAQATSRDGSTAGEDSAKTSPTIVDHPKIAEGVCNDIEGGNPRVREGVFSRVFWRRNSSKSPTPPPGPTEFFPA